MNAWKIPLILASAALGSCAPGLIIENEEIPAKQVVVEEDASVSIPISLVVVPDSLDNRYRYNVRSTSNLTTYQGVKGSKRQLLSYYADDRRLHVSDRSFPSGQFSDPVDVHDAIGGDDLELDNNSTTAVAVAPNGIIFVTGNQHGDPLRMARSQVPNSLDQGWSQVRPSDMGSMDEADRVSYPSFFTVNDHLYLSYREQELQPSRYRWLIKRYDHLLDRWEDAAQLNTGIDLRLYVSHIVTDDKNANAHLTGIWRDDSTDNDGLDQHHDFFHMVSDDGANWKQYDHGVQKIPLEWNSNEPSSIIWDTPEDPIPQSAGTVVVDSTGNPHALVRGRSDNTNYHIYWSGSQWIQEALPWTETSFEIFRCNDQVFALTSASQDIRLYSLDPQDPLFETPHVLTSGYTQAPAYHLSVDKEALHEGAISILLTLNESNRLGSETEPYSQPAWILTTPCDEFITLETSSQSD